METQKRILEAEIYGSQDDQLRAWCTHCRHYHVHGRADAPVGTLTHRVAHCWVPRSPYEPGGYMLLVVPRREGGQGRTYRSRRSG